MTNVEKYINYISLQKRYSKRTVEIYSDILARFYDFVHFSPGDTEALNTDCVRSYQVSLIEDSADSPRTVNLHLSVISGYCNYLIKQDLLANNPVRTLVRPKQSRRLPVFYKESSMETYLAQDNVLSSKAYMNVPEDENERRKLYEKCLSRMIVCLLYSTGIRRSELISLDAADVDYSRKTITVTGKGDKMRTVPLVDSLAEELKAYSDALSKLCGCVRKMQDPLLLTWKGNRTYPVLVDRAVKAELGELPAEFAGRKSPHALRHSLATALLEEGAGLDEIKQVLGHANLAATQIYTHSSVRMLKQTYMNAHPRAGESKKKD